MDNTELDSLVQITRRTLGAINSEIEVIIEPGGDNDDDDNDY